MKVYTCKICKKENLTSKEMRWERCWASQCKNCYAQSMKDYRLKRKNEGNPILRINKYGITNSQYHKLVELHLGGCAICKQPCNSGMRLAVDHNHKTGKIRGLLCGNCNQALGRIKDNEEILFNMMEYLKNDGVLNHVSY